MVYQRSEQVDDAFFALSHPVRRAVLEQLANGSLSVGAVGKPHNLSPAQLTKHLAILERGGLLRRERRGREHHLKLNPDPLKDILDWVQQYQRFWDTRLEALARYLDKRAAGASNK